MSAIHVEIFGQGQPLIMLHGWAMHSGVWQDFGRLLSEHFQVILVDLPGHGFSAAIEPFELESIVDVLLPILPQEQVIVLGWSLGATVALAMAQRVPERVKHVIMLAGNPQFIQTDDWPGVKTDTLDAFAELLKTGVQQTLIRFLALQVNGLAHGKALLQTLKQAVQTCPPPSDSVLQAGLDILKNSDLREFMSRDLVSISVILGYKDTLIPVACGQAIQGLNSRIDMQILDSAGHAAFLSHQEQLVSIIKRVHHG